MAMKFSVTRQLFDVSVAIRNTHIHELAPLEWLRYFVFILGFSSREIHPQVLFFLSTEVESCTGG